MTPNSHSVSRKVPRVRVLRQPTRSLQPHRLPSLQTQQPHPKPQLGPWLRTRMERTSGKVLGVHVATGIIHPHSGHLPLGTRLSFSRRRLQREGVSARTRKLRLHKRPLPVVNRPLNQPPPVLLPLQVLVRLT